MWRDVTLAAINCHNQSTGLVNAILHIPIKMHYGEWDEKLGEIQEGNIGF